MRRIYFLRHGMPDFPGGQHMCIGTTDIPLGALGRMQAFLAGKELRQYEINAVFSSPLSRALETAEYIVPSPIVRPGFSEMYAGIWDGYTFSEIKEKWPELYSARGKDPTLDIPESEDVFTGQKRFADEVFTALKETNGDIVIAAHATVIQSFICLAAGVSPKLTRNYSPIPYGSYSVINIDKRMELEVLGKVPEIKLSTDICIGLLEAAGVSKNIREHCIRTAKKTEEIIVVLNKAGLNLDRELAVNSALLHDIARSENRHDIKGADWMTQLGYEAEASIVRQHHDIDFKVLNEASVVYIADKCINGSEEVGIDKRFEISAEKCFTEEAALIHRRRYETACEIRNTINAVCGKETIL